jgi:hypothetical protein
MRGIRELPARPTVETRRPRMELLRQIDLTWVFLIALGIDIGIVAVPRLLSLAG